MSPKIAPIPESSTKASTDALARLFRTARSHPSPCARDLAANAICRYLLGLVDRRLRLPRSVRSYREDCVQELSLGLFELLRGWEPKGKLAELRSLDGFVSHYLKWHLPPTLRRLKFGFGGSSSQASFIRESDLNEQAEFRNHPLRPDASGCHHTATAGSMRHASEDAALRGMQVAELDPTSRHVLGLIERGETGRRRIELSLVQEFGMSHRQARRVLDEAPERVFRHL